MSAVVDTARPTAEFRRGRLTFRGILGSEWIKFTSLASSIWCLALIVVATLGLAVLMAISFRSADGFAPPELGLLIATSSTTLVQLVVLVLGALVITREYGTGMIRSTFTAAPRRLSVLAAKAIVFAAIVFVISLVSMLATTAITAMMLGAEGGVDLGDPESWRVLGGAALFLALVGLLGLGLGTLLRNTAGAIASGIGLLLVLPVILSMFDVEWVREASRYLPLTAGQAIYAIPLESTVPPEAIGSMPEAFEPWQGLLIMLAWVVIVLVPAAVLLRRRDA